ncbi:MAG: prenyltransferase/squalene oxidase repeat-containing protein [Planctomycetota bacterium]
MAESKYTVETNLVPIWEQEQTFQEIMADQLRHAPWIMISLLGHAVVFLILFTFIKGDPLPEPEQVIEASPPPPVEDLEDPPEPEPEPEPEPVETEDVVVQETDVVTETETTSVSESFNDTNTTESAFNSDGWNAAIGLGGGAGGTRGGRGGGRSALKGRGTARAIENALKWLRDHQDEDGKWDCDEFMKHDEGEPCTNPGNAAHDVGVTALALLAFLGDGSTLRSGPFKKNVKQGVAWLRDQMDPDTGLIGVKAAHDYIYDHALATLALVEAAGLSNSRIVKRDAAKAIEYLEYHRNPYNVWRYEPKSGENDTSITGWAVFALKSARDFDMTINDSALDLSLAWFDEMTDPTTGRTGYLDRGGLSSRRPGDHNDRFPREKGECMTAVSLLCRIFLEKEHNEDGSVSFSNETQQLLEQQADLILETKPEWDEAAGTIDHYYWYYGTYALFQMGGRRWKTWEKALETAVVKQQRTDGNFNGSWDAAGAWGEDGGRVYSTALLALTLEAYYRYSRLIR